MGVVCVGTADKETVTLGWLEGTFVLKGVVGANANSVPVKIMEGFSSIGGG